MLSLTLTVLLQMLRQGWILRRAGNDPTHGTPRREASEMSACVPVVVHHRSDEQTLTAAAGYLARGVPGACVPYIADDTSLSSPLCV